MAAVSGGCKYVFALCCILLLYCTPSYSLTRCPLPLVATENEVFANGCGLLCNDEDAATPWTDRPTNKLISMLFLAFLIPAFVCNVIFTINNFFEHRENEETFQTTPVTYDALFVIDAAYLVVIVCLIIPHFSFFDGGNTVSNAYICNHDEPSLSIGNPVRGSNGLCSFFGLLIFTGFKVILIYTGILCVNIWYRLWRPMVAAGMKKKYIHGAAWLLVALYDIVVLAVGGIDANPSNGVCYVSADNIPLLLLVDIVPNVLFIIVSVICMAHAAHNLHQELSVIQQAELVTSDLLNLIHRMLGFLCTAVAGSAFVVFTEIVWISSVAAWRETTDEWIQCTRDAVYATSRYQYKYEIGDQCIAELKEEGAAFPSALFFIAFPIAALLSNVSIIILTCHRRQSQRWRETASVVKETMQKLKPRKRRLSSISEIHIKTPQIKRMTSNHDEPTRTDQPPTIQPLKPAANDPVPVTPDDEKDSSSGSDDNEPAEPHPQQPKSSMDVPTTDLSVNLRGSNISVHLDPNANSPLTEHDAPYPDTVRYHGSVSNPKMSFNATPTFASMNGATPTASLPGGVPSLQLNDTVVRHPTPHDQKVQAVSDTDLHEYQRRQDEKQQALDRAQSMSVHEQTAKLVELDRARSSSKRDRLQHVANASFDYHNLQKRANGSKSLPNQLGLKDTASGGVVVKEEDIQQGEEMNKRLQSLQGNGNQDEPRKSERSNTLPTFMKRTSTARKFESYLEEELEKQSTHKLSKGSKSTKSVRFVDTVSPSLTPSNADSANDSEMDLNKRAAEAILRSTTDSLVHRAQNEEDEQLKDKEAKKKKLRKFKSSVDATNAKQYEFNKLNTDSVMEDVEQKEMEPDIGDRRLSHQQRQEAQLKEVTERHRVSFFDKFGKRKRNISKIGNRPRQRKSNKWGMTIKHAADFKTSTGLSLMTPSGLLKPLTMESLYHIDTEYLADDDAISQATTYATQSSFETLLDDPNQIQAVMHHPVNTMGWQSGGSIFHFTLADAEFKSMLQTTFTPRPQSAQNGQSERQMTFDPDDLYGRPSIIDENKEKGDEDGSSHGTTMSQLKPTGIQSMNDLKFDQSVTGIGSDGRIVLSDVARFKFAKQAQSVPIATDSKNVLSEDEEHEYETKYDDDELVQKINPPKAKAPMYNREKSHHRNETLHGRLLDSVPHADRKNLLITIHSDFSAQVEEKGRHHYKAETAKLNFTLRPVHSMKILM